MTVQSVQMSPVTTSHREAMIACWLEKERVDDDRQAIALWLAQRHIERESKVRAVYWVPDKSEKLHDFKVNLIETENELYAGAPDEVVYTLSFYDTPSFPFPCEIAILLPMELDKRPLPEKWGGWSAWKSAVKLVERKSAV